MKTQDLAKIAKRQCHLNFVGQELSVTWSLEFDLLTFVT